MIAFLMGMFFYVRVQIFIYSYFDMRSRFRLLVVEVDHPVELDGIYICNQSAANAFLSVT